MLISRRGYGADHGPRCVEIPDPVIGWDKEDASIFITARNIEDFATPARHNYSIYISPSEFSKMVSAIANARASNALSDALAPILRDLIRLATVCIWPPAASPLAFEAAHDAVPEQLAVAPRDEGVA